MTTLSAQTIRRLSDPKQVEADNKMRAKVGLPPLAPLIDGFNEAQLQGASYDVFLGGNSIEIECEPPGLWDYNNGPFFRTFTFPAEVPPKHGFLGVLREKINLPLGIECVFHLCSTDGRKLRDHTEAGFADPGYFGCMTIEPINQSVYVPWVLNKGDRIGQLVFRYLDFETDKPYQGRYQGAERVSGAKKK